MAKVASKAEDVARTLGEAMAPQTKPAEAPGQAVPSGMVTKWRVTEVIDYGPTNLLVRLVALENPVFGNGTPQAGMEMYLAKRDAAWFMKKGAVVTVGISPEI